MAWAELYHATPVEQFESPPLVRIVPAGTILLYCWSNNQQAQGWKWAGQLTLAPRFAELPFPAQRIHSLYEYLPLARALALELPIASVDYELILEFAFYFNNLEVWIWRWE